MGKLSGVAMILLMFNIIGYLLVSVQVAMGYATSNPFLSQETIIGRLYVPTQDINNQTVYLISGTSTVYTDPTNGLPQTTPPSLVQQGITFIDRIFVIFAPLRMLLGILVFPVAFVGYLGLPYALTMLLIAPLTLLYFFGFIDLITGGSN